MTGADAWQTPGSRQALAEVARANAEFEAAVRQSREAERQVRDSPDFRQRLRAVEDYARGRAAPRALRDLQTRIDRGELSWAAIATGRHLDDPDVRAVLAEGIAEPVPSEDTGDEAPDGRGYAFMRFDPDAAD